MCDESKIYPLDAAGLEALRDYFTRSGTEENEASSDKVYVFAMTTDCIKFAAADQIKIGAEELKELSENGLDIRVFDKKREAKWFRASIDKEFRFRLLDDDILQKDDLHIWDESHFLDIDADKTRKARKQGGLEKGTVFATGGGKYPLPIENYENAKIRIRNYLGEDADTGELYVEDWRLAGFGEWPKRKGGE